MCPQVTSMCYINPVAVLAVRGDAMLNMTLVGCALQSESDFMDGEVLPTMLENANLTIMLDEVNNTEVVTVVSYASEATIVTPAAYACNVSSTPSSYPFTIMQYTALCCHQSRGAAFTCVSRSSSASMLLLITMCSMLPCCHACTELSR